MNDKLLPTIQEITLEENVESSKTFYFVYTTYKCQNSTKKNLQYNNNRPDTKKKALLSRENHTDERKHKNAKRWFKVLLIILEAILAFIVGIATVYYGARMNPMEKDDEKEKATVVISLFLFENEKFTEVKCPGRQKRNGDCRLDAFDNDAQQKKQRMQKISLSQSTMKTNTNNRVFLTTKGFESHIIVIQCNWNYLSKQGWNRSQKLSIQDQEKAAV
jgi:hypothetical protein